MSFAYILFLEIDWLSVPGLVLEEDNVTLSCHYNVSADKASTPHMLLCWSIRCKNREIFKSD